MMQQLLLRAFVRATPCLSEIRSAKAAVDLAAWLGMASVKHLTATYTNEF